MTTDGKALTAERSVGEQIGAIKGSGRFDIDWYLSSYPDVAQSGMDPIRHYVMIGSRLGRNPSAEFSTKQYIKEHPELDGTGLCALFCSLEWPLGHQDGDQPVPARPRIRAEEPGNNEASKNKPTPIQKAADGGSERSGTLNASELDARLWGGYARYAQLELEALKDDAQAPLEERVKAAWSLRGWYFMEEDYRRAYENIALINLLDPTMTGRRLIAEVQCLIELGRYEEALRRSDEGIEELGEMADLLVLQSAVHGWLGQEEAQLECLNKSLQIHGLATMRKKDSDRPLTFFNLVSQAEAKITDQTEKVSIVMPVYNATDLIRHAVESLLSQTWQNIEIVVVDDYSTDNTCEVLDQLSAEDSRVIVVKKTVNEGAYPTRNAGLSKATGDLIMVHDSDDWSHPQKIELQIAELRANPKLVAVMSHWLRVDEQLRPAWKGRMGGMLYLYSLNFSSLLFKREVIEKLGPWDAARVSADAEFRSRIQSYYGADALLKLPFQMMLSLSLSREESLTRTKETHVRTLYFGLRWLYRDSYTYWHRHPSFHDSPSITDGRKFPMPHGNRTVPGARTHYDIILVGDLATRGGPLSLALSYLEAACGLGKSVALVHWRKYALRPTTSINSAVYDLCLEHEVDVLSPDDAVLAGTVLVTNPGVLPHMPDRFPKIRVGMVVVIVSQYAERQINRSGVEYDPRAARVSLQTLFGHGGVWVPVSETMRRLMDRDDRYPSAFGHVWRPFLNTQRWCLPPLRWRGGNGNPPIVGRHGRDSYTKWPKVRSDVEDAYLADKAWEVRFLGGAERGIRVLGRTPENWRIEAYDAVPVPEFLQGLDFFLHFPREEYIKEIGHAVIEAMSAGIPVVLPPRFRLTFEGAAIYARPAEVGAKIAEVWASEEAYLEQAKNGRDFVFQQCDISRLRERLEQLQDIGE